MQGEQRKKNTRKREKRGVEKRGGNGAENRKIFKKLEKCQRDLQKVRKGKKSVKKNFKK